MDASEREKERLRKLAELYDRTDLSDEQYRREYDRIASEYQTESATTSTNPIVSPSDFPSDSERSQESIFEKATEFLEKEAVEKIKSREGMSSPSFGDNALASNEYAKPKGSTTTPPVIDSRGYQTPRDTFSSGQLHCIQPTITMKRVRPGRSQLVFVPLVFALGLGLAMAIGVVRRSAIKPTPNATPSNPAAVASLTQASTQSVAQPRFIAPHFGPDAVASCKSRCERWQGQEHRVCNNGCNRRSLEMYGRRITLEELSPRAEADDIVQGCSVDAKALSRAKSEQEWRSGLLPFVTSVKDISDAKGVHYSRELYKDLYSAQGKAVLPPESPEGSAELDTFTKRVLSAACLIAHDALALWAFETAERQDDEFSAAFYAQIREELTKPKYQHVEYLKDETASVWGEFSP